MHVSYKLLQEFVNLKDISVADFVSKVTIAGLEIEEAKPLAVGDNLIIGYVNSCEDHPKSDHLHVCQVNIGKEILQIVCGASNVAAGQKVIVAQSGAFLPAKGLTIQKTVIRGVESNGMICSLLELGVAENRLSQASIDGIEVLGDDAVIGDENPLTYLGLDDVILELKPTPNRGDVLSVMSFAYDVAAILKRDILFDLHDVKQFPTLPTKVSAVSTTTDCHYFNVQKVNNVIVKDSPKWLQDVLLACNIRPVNNVVDIGNYVMLIYGQPIHLYDAKQLANLAFTVENKTQQKLLALDDANYEVLAGDIAICAGKQIECLGGVIGAQHSMIQTTTTEVVVEAAVFNPIAIRKTSRRLQLFSDASTRFVRGVDETRTRLALQKTVQFLFEIAEAKTAEKLVTFGQPVAHEVTIDLHLNKVNSVLGTSYTMLEVESALKRLNFTYSKTKDTLHVVPTYYRKDIKIEEDLIEEVVRMLGFETIPTSFPVANTIGYYSPAQIKKRQIKEYFTSNGMHEAYSYSLVSTNMIDDFCLLAANAKSDAHQLLMPMSEDHAFMRKSITPSLLQAINYNQARKNADVMLFEMASVYSNQKENELVAIAISGNLPSTKWRENITADFYQVKGFIEGVFTRLGIEEKRYSLVNMDEDSTFLHPGRSCYIIEGKKKIGFIGQIHPNMEKKYAIKPTFVAELDLTHLLAMQVSKTKFKAPSIYPAIHRDIALVVEQAIEANSLLKLIKKIGRERISEVDVFDIYMGDNIQSGHKSIAISIIYQDLNKTMTDQEIQQLHAEITNSLCEKFRAELRK